jgi:site-specific recombinase XerD
MKPTFTLGQALDYFLLSRQHLARSTRAHYRIILRPLAESLEKEASEVTELDLLQYLDGVYGRGYKPATVAGHVRDIKTFFRFLHQKGVIRTNPAAELQPPEVRYDDPKAISLDDFLRVLNYANARRNKRDVAILVFLLGTGCRVAGLANLRLQDLDFPGRRAQVNEKGNKTRWVFLDDVVITALGDYLEHGRPVTDSDRVFIGERGPLASTAITAIVIRLGRAAHVSGPCSPHAFRHAYSIMMMEHGAPLAAVSQILGHADPHITAKYYARFATSALQRIHDEHNPLHQLMLVKQER